jgi:hypothetical protein
VLDGLGPVPLMGTRFLSAQCRVCNETASSQLAGLGLCLPVGRRFWREHPALQILPETVVDAGGPALVTGFQDRRSAGRLEVVYSLASLRILQIHQS